VDYVQDGQDDNTDFQADEPELVHMRDLSGTYSYFVSAVAVVLHSDYRLFVFAKRLCCHAVCRLRMNVPATLCVPKKVYKVQTDTCSHFIVPGVVN